MSGEGAPRLEVPDCGDMRVGVVAALWHQEVMEGLLDGALRALSEAGITQPPVLRARAPSISRFLRVHWRPANAMPSLH